LIEFLRTQLQAVEIRILGDPVEWPVHLTVPIIDGAPQADNHLMIKVQRSMYACRVVCSFPGWRAVLPGQPAGSIPLFGGWQLPVLLARPRLSDRDFAACDMSRYAQSRSHVMEFRSGASALCFVQAPAESHEQLGNAQAVMKALAFP